MLLICDIHCENMCAIINLDIDAYIGVCVCLGAMHKLLILLYFKLAIHNLIVTFSKSFLKCYSEKCIF